MKQKIKIIDKVTGKTLEKEAKIRKNYYDKHRNDPEYKRKHAEANKRWAEKKNKKVLILLRTFLFSRLGSV